MARRLTSLPLVAPLVLGALTGTGCGGDTEHTPPQPPPDSGTDTGDPPPQPPPDTAQD